MLYFFEDSNCARPHQIPKFNLFYVLLIKTSIDSRNYGISFQIKLLNNHIDRRVPVSMINYIIRLINPQYENWYPYPTFSNCKLFEYSKK